jgi:hypothetical protein
MNNLSYSAVGLFKLIFVNEITLTERDCIALTNFMNKFPNTWNNFGEYLISDPYKVREEIFQLFPRTGFFFSKSVIQLLKIAGG